ncbi:hypothetical protein MAA_08611 [Metarhizium robertsii ARSEF 23]|nr:uncharacterized protein MAA_08611 [Metarhizium robertsii ARSEF 23]EFY95958.1 hypothetical protein MAA_08611 [Metarhizium robertsii ARSEF 23]
MLGAFVKEFPSPTTASVPTSRPESKSLFTQYDKYGTEDVFFTEFIIDTHKSSATEATATLQSLAKVSFKGETNEAHHLKGKILHCRRLTQIDEFFNDVKADKDVKERVPKWIQHGMKLQVCMVVGILLCEDVNVVWEEVGKMEVGVKAEAPITTIVRAAAGVPSVDPSQDPGNLSVAASAKKSTGNVFRASGGKRQIFALELRTVTKGKILNTINRNVLRMGRTGPSVDYGRKFGKDKDDSVGCLEDEELFLGITESKEKKGGTSEAHQDK